MSRPLVRAAEEALRDLRSRNLERRESLVEDARGAYVTIGGRRLVSFVSNDYLGLARHPALAEAARTAADSFGWGAGSARLLAGTTPPHADLEETVAQFLGAQAALSFPSGYMANLALVVTASRDAHVFSDELNHASLIDACRLSRAPVSVYRHLDLDDLRAHLRMARRRPIIVTEGVFSMEGDLAPLPDLADLATEFGADILLDDAHGFGVLGAHGRGTAEHWNRPDAPTARVVTFSKAAGASGAAVVGPAALIDWLRASARTYLFTTATPPAVAAAAAAGVRALAGAHEARRRLLANVQHLRQRLGRPGVTPIVPHILGPTPRALKTAAGLRELGFFLPAIRPPSVPEGSARLRISITALHEPAHLDAMAGALAAP